MAKNIEFSAEEMSELHAFYTMEMEKAELRLKAIKSIIAKIGSAPQKRGPKPSVQKKLNNELNSELEELNKTKVVGRKRGRPAKIKTSNAEPKILKRRGRPAKVKSEIITLDSVTNADVISMPKKRGPKPGAKYKKTAGKKTQVSKTPKTEIKKSASVDSITALVNVQDSPKKRGPKPGAKYKKTAAKKTRVAKAPKVKLAKIENSKPVSAESTPSTGTTKDSSKKRGPKAVTKNTKRSVERKPIKANKVDSTIVKKEKSVAKKANGSSAPKIAKKVTQDKAAVAPITDMLESMPTSINNEIKALKLSVAKLNKPKAVKVSKAVVVKSGKAKAVKVNNTAKKSPVVKVTPAKVDSSDATKEQNA